jgi:hypothetical protein
MTNRILRFNVSSPEIKKPPGSYETFYNSDHATASIKPDTQGVFAAERWKSACLFASVDSVEYPRELRGDQLCDPAVRAGRPPGGIFVTAVPKMHPTPLLSKHERQAGRRWLG